MYNHAELRGLLENAGHRYRTQSDTETLVHAYEESGRRSSSACTACSRSRSGIARASACSWPATTSASRPLYWTRANGAFVCASEIKALFAFPGVRREADADAVVQHLTLRYAAAPRTMFADIEKLPPGHHLTSRGRPHDDRALVARALRAQARARPRTRRCVRSSVG
jgi:asparagine synthase (glutamine-hydrolysing)